LRRKNQYKRKPEELPKKDTSKTAGIDEAELSRRKAAGECLRCAWPSDRKGSHRVAECRRPIKLERGVAGFPKAKTRSAPRQIPEEEISSELSSSEESSDDSL
jgi:hypothetical protein